jgi:hypothetical protein
MVPNEQSALNLTAHPEGPSASRTVKQADRVTAVVVVVEEIVVLVVTVVDVVDVDVPG